MLSARALVARATPRNMLRRSCQSFHATFSTSAATAARASSTAAAAAPAAQGSDGGSVTLPQSKRVVIIGGGVIGCSVAYNLSKLGWGPDVLLLEQNQLTSGTTWHAAGLIGTARQTEAETRLSVDGMRIIKDVERETGQSTGFKPCGCAAVESAKGGAPCHHFAHAAPLAPASLAPARTRFSRCSLSFFF
jgi:hypothetical protein